MFWVVLFLLIVFGVPVVLLIYVYNRLILTRNRVDEAYSRVDVLLTKRADLIPNLVESVKGYAAHEKTVLQNVTASRSAVLAAGQPSDKFRADESLTAALRNLFAVVENYPNLKADQNFRELQGQLATIESELAVARNYYNETVRIYNTQQQTFPANLFATAFGHAPRSFYEVAAEKKEPPKVSF